MFSCYVKRTLNRLPLTKRRKVGTTSNHHAPYALGYTRTTMAQTKGSDTARWSKSHKRRPSSDCRLQPACMKLELLVIADQHAAVNTFPGFVHTARQTMKVGNEVSRPQRQRGRNCIGFVVQFLVSILRDARERDSKYHNVGV